MNDLDFRGRHAVITGGATGLGHGIAQRLIASGGRVTLWDRDADAARAAAQALGEQAVAVTVDVTQWESVNAALRTTLAVTPRVDALVNSAGITGPNTKLWDYPVDAWRAVMDVNVNGVFLCCRALGALMREQGYGRIVNIASVAGKDGNPNASAYSASKAAVIGLNYADHAAESGLPIPAEPVVFMKATSCIQGPNDPVMLPKGSVKSDWEVELGIVIGTRARYVSKKDALAHVAGYCTINDVSEREFQLERGPQWDKGKGCDTFGPIGPWLVTTDEIENVQRLDMWLDLNGKRVQTGNTRTMIFDCAKLVSYLSQFMTLLPGDIITTGTPPGVGLGMKPPLYLKKGDVMELGIQGLGSQRQVVVPFKL
ncbi:MAG: SDR family NAD(P)-dependent oxidoreductase [Haliea sp.]|nr:MAG: SDR family NAD(P)-dependent oxidoreductase [Haliea sp.]